MKEKTLYEIRVSAKAGYFGFFKVRADDVQEATIIAKHQFAHDHGLKNIEGLETYCFNPHQKYDDDHA